jgi:hypothetical protein
LLLRPFTPIVVFVAVMVASPLDCIRSPVLLVLGSGGKGLAIFEITIGFEAVPFAVIEMLAVLEPAPVELAALTALALPPGGMMTLTPGSSVTLMAVFRGP